MNDPKECPFVIASYYPFCHLLVAEWPQSIRRISRFLCIHHNWPFCRNSERIVDGKFWNIMIKFPLTSAPEQLSLITDCCSNAFTVITFPLDVNTIKLNTYNIALSASTTSDIWAFTVFAKIGLFVALMCLLMLADFSEQIWREQKWANTNKHEYNLCYQHGLSWCACWHPSLWNVKQMHTKVLQLKLSLSSECFLSLTPDRIHSTHLINEIFFFTGHC